MRGGGKALRRSRIGGRVVPRSPAIHPVLARRRPGRRLERRTQIVGLAVPIGNPLRRLAPHILKPLSAAPPPPPRAPFSHSASVGRRFPSHRQYSRAWVHETATTG